MVTLLLKAANMARDEGLAAVAVASKRKVRRTGSAAMVRVRRVSHKLRYGRSMPREPHLIMSSPQMVEYYLLSSSHTDSNYSENIPPQVGHVHEMDKGCFNQKRNIGTVRAGDWDLHKRRWEHHQLYNSVWDACVNGTPWEETEFIQRCLTCIDIAGGSFGYTNRERFLTERIPYLQWIYRNMKLYGYMMQEECPKDHRNRGVMHEVAVNIGRSGEIIFNNSSGNHRLSFAKILNVPEIPLLVIVRHERWQALRKEIYSARSVSELSAEARCHLEHPDMRDVAETLSPYDAAIEGRQ